MKSFRALLAFLFLAGQAYSQCGTAIPAAPSCPVGGTTMTSNGSGFALGNGVTYKVTGTVNLTGGSLNNGNSSTTLYVCSGGTLSITTPGPGDYSPGAGVKVYVLEGGTLNVYGNYNGGQTYVYGNLNTYTTVNGSSISLQNNVHIYVANTGVWQTNYSPRSQMNLNSGKVIVEGVAKIGELNQVQNAGSEICANNGGCIEFTSISNSGSLANVASNQLGSGYIYYSNTTCPTAAALTNDATLKICTRQPAGPCNYWGSATVTYNCLPGNGGTSNNCSGAIALPIHLNYFRARKSEKGVNISWATSLQKDAKLFVIERSQDGMAWDVIKTVPANGSEVKFTEYEVYDEFPLGGLNYYRLKEIDIQDQERIYSTDVVSIEEEASLFSIIPNPSNGKITILVNGTYEAYDATVQDISGRTLQQHKLQQGKNFLETNLKPGVYYVKIKIQRETQTFKMVVE